MAIEYKMFENMASNEIGVTATMSKYEAMLEKELPMVLFESIVDKLTDKFIELHGDEILASVDIKNVTQKIEDGVGLVVAKKAIGDLSK